MIQKTKILTLIVFGLLFLNLSAQGEDLGNDPTAKLPDNDRKFRFGLQFSPNISWFKTNTTGYESDGSRVGFSYGLSFECFMTKNYLFSTGVMMQNSGGGLDYKGSFTRLSRIYAADVNATYKLKSIEVPLLLKLRTNEIGYLTYFGQFGLTTAFNYKSSAIFDYLYEDANSVVINYMSESIKDASEDINWINMYLVIGAGVEYNISGNTSLTIGVTFNNGFINQLDTKVNALDINGDAAVDKINGTAIYTEKDANANLNYVALSVGIYF